MGYKSRQRKVLNEGDYTNSLLNGRFKRNKNVLLAVTGSTGSGKSYACLRIAELWYKKKFNRQFTIDHVCFSNGEAMKLLASGKLEKGELLVCEEVGVNLGSLDFQQRTSKMFVYVLQSFRSMNVGLLMNLPVLTMLNKGTRQLLHGHMITTTINPAKKEVTLKLYLHQLNQNSGKSYWKFPRILNNHRMTSLERMNFGLPSKELIIAYEQKKASFLSQITTNYTKEYEDKERETVMKMSRGGLSNIQFEVFKYLGAGLNPKQISEKRQCHITAVYHIIETIRHKGYELPKPSKKGNSTRKSGILDVVGSSGSSLTQFGMVGSG